jgi:hypothetical protein
MDKRLKRVGVRVNTLVGISEYPFYASEATTAVLFGRNLQAASSFLASLADLIDCYYEIRPFGSRIISAKSHNLGHTF